MPRITRGGDPAEGRRAEKVVRQVEVRMVKEVKGLGAELKIEAFAKSSVFHQRDVDVLKTRAIKDVAARISKRTRCGKRKRTRVEPLPGRWIRKLRITHQVRSVVSSKTENRSTRTAVVDLR